MDVASCEILDRQGNGRSVSKEKCIKVVQSQERKQEGKSISRPTPESSHATHQDVPFLVTSMRGDPSWPVLITPRSNGCVALGWRQRIGSDRVVQRRRCLRALHKRRAEGTYSWVVPGCRHQPRRIRVIMEGRGVAVVSSHPCQDPCWNGPDGIAGVHVDGICKIQDSDLSILVRSARHQVSHAFYEPASKAPSKAIQLNVGQPHFGTCGDIRGSGKRSPSDKEDAPLR